MLKLFTAGWSSPVARLPHKQKVVSSNLTPAILLAILFLFAGCDNEYTAPADPIFPPEWSPTPEESASPVEVHVITASDSYVLNGHDTYVSDSRVRIHCQLEPIVTKQDNGWLITFDE